MEPWQPARVRPQKEVVSPRELPGGRAWPGYHVIAECGALLGFPALASVLSPVGPAANIPSDNGPTSKESQLSPNPSLCHQKGQVGDIYTEPLDVALQSSGGTPWLFMPLEYPGTFSVAHSW